MVTKRPALRGSAGTFPSSLRKPPGGLGGGAGSAAQEIRGCAPGLEREALPRGAAQTAPVPAAAGSRARRLRLGPAEAAERGRLPGWSAVVQYQLTVALTSRAQVIP
ncbi:unconventional myosin-XVB-like isoform X2 [Macaca thibetana thibetana]|uniref:unconventional myosin-XVB-like isoform X2 n=1 Tax=Macaca thibetana thibetana TaxID=257877 RepID=UPI0021BC52A3|nr:unconventional myosin-XVB-like isoform X2 [Macaca thibetana thibetana]